MKKMRKISLLLVLVLLGQFVMPAQASIPYDDSVVEDKGFTDSLIYYAELLLFDFNSDSIGVGSWMSGKNASSVRRVASFANGPGIPYEGDGCLELVSDAVKCYEWRSMYRPYTSAQPLDLFGYNFISMAANSYGWRGDDDFFIRLTLSSESGETYTATSQFKPNMWNTVFFDISGCDFKNAITRLEVGFMKNDDLSDITDPNTPGYAGWNGMLQIDYVCASVAADLNFNAPGCSEGFIGSAGVLASQSEGYMVVEVPEGGGYIQSPRLDIDATIYNVIDLKGVDLGGEDMVLQWSHDGNAWPESNSLTLPASKITENLAEFKIASDMWNGTVHSFRIVFDNGEAKTLKIDKISFDYKVLDTYQYAGAVNSVRINGAEITVTGSLGLGYSVNAIVALYELQVYENEKTVDYDARAPLDTAGASGTFALAFPVMDGLHSRVYSKFVAVLENGADKTLIDIGKFVTNPEALSVNNEPYPIVDSIKGLQVQLASDAELLGVKHGAINIDFNNMMSINDRGAATIPYVFEGKTYYFIKSHIDYFDNQIKSMTNNGMTVTAILIMYRTGLDDPNSPNKYLIHPGHLPGGTVFAINLTNDIGVEYYKAAMSFLADRYSRPDKLYGRLDGYIVGNEVGQNYVWNNMGDVLIGEYVEQYERQVRMTYNIVKQAWSEARVYISLDHFWNHGNPATATRIYDNKKIVDMLNELTKERGDIGWNIAFHPYPQDLFDPRTWNDATATDSPDTYRITFKNLQVLVEYLRQTQMRYNGSARRVILSEQGFHGGNNGQAAQELQAAAYAYAYYKAASLPEIDAFILHRHVDHNQEGGLMLGLWTCENGEICEAGNKKLIYEIFRDIDRTNSYDISAFSLDVIRSTGVSVTDWSDVIAEFDPGTINASRPTISIANAGMVGNIDGIVPIMDPQDKTMGWYATDNVSEIALKTWDGAEAIAGAASSTYKNDFCGITYQPAVPLDLTLMPYIVIDVSATGMGSGTQAEYMLRAYSGDDVIEGAITAAKGEWNTFAFDLSGWSGLKSVDRIKIWAKPVNSYAWRDGDILIGALSAASSAYLTNALVEIDINKVSKLDDAVTVTVTNKGNDNLSANALIKGQNGLSFDLSEYELDIAPGDKTSFQIKVTAIGIVPGNAGILNVTINGIESNFTITDYVYYDYIIDANRNMVLGSFDNAMTDGWIAKINTASIESVKNVDPMPTSAPEGGYMLAATKAATLATVESSVIKNFGEPVDMSAYDVINFYFFGWGGTSASYTATLTLTAQNGASKKYELDSPPDNQWKYYTVDITDFADRDKVASISIGYRGDDMVFHGDIWTGKFCIAQIKLPLPFYNLTVNYLNSKGEQLSSPYTASGIAWHDAVNFPVYEPFALGTLSRTIFDTEYELQDLDVVSGLASMPRGDVVMNCYYTIPVDVDIDVIGGNGQVDVNFPILSANGKGYCVFIAKESDGDYELYPNVNFNAKGVHIKGLENGKEYYVIIAYTLNDQTITSDSIKIIPSK